jgi:hypothetical protein
VPTNCASTWQNFPKPSCDSRLFFDESRRVGNRDDIRSPSVVVSCFIAIVDVEANRSGYKVANSSSGTCRCEWPGGELIVEMNGTRKLSQEHCKKCHKKNVILT